MPLTLAMTVVPLGSTAGDLFRGKPEGISGGLTFLTPVPAHLIGGASRSRFIGKIMVELATCPATRLCDSRELPAEVVDYGASVASTVPLRLTHLFFMRGGVLLPFTLAQPCRSWFAHIGVLHRAPEIV
jgi:hypothetical protein